MNTIIRREFVLKSGHSQNVTNIVKVPTIDSEAVVVDKISFKRSFAITDWFGVLATSAGLVAIASSKKLAL